MLGVADEFVAFDLFRIQPVNRFQELRLNAEALKAAVEQDPKFFASVSHYVKRLYNLVTTKDEEVTQAELKVLAGKLEDFWRQWRPSGNGFYIPPRETTDTDSTVKEIGRIVAELWAMEEGSFPRTATFESDVTKS